jgi:hypothetical protein
MGSNDCDLLHPVKKSCVQVSCLTANAKAVLESRMEGVDQRAKAEGYSTAEQAKS